VCQWGQGLDAPSKPEFNEPPRTSSRYKLADGGIGLCDSGHFGLAAPGTEEIRLPRSVLISSRSSESCFSGSIVNFSNGLNPGE
jgi:hypothetical protein